MTYLFVLSVLLSFVKVRADDYYCHSCSGIGSCSGNYYAVSSPCWCEGGPCFSSSPSPGTTTLPSALSDSLFGVYWVEIPAFKQIDVDLSSLAILPPFTISMRTEMYDGGSSVSFQAGAKNSVFTIKRYCTSAEDPFYDQTAYMSIHFKGESSGEFSISDPVPSTQTGCPVVTLAPTRAPTSLPTSVPTSSPTRVPTREPTSALTRLTSSPTKAAAAPFNIYVVGYTDGYCSDYFAASSVQNGRDGCLSETVDGTVVSFMAECLFPEASSQWTVSVFLSSDCSGSSVASFVGYGSSECAFLSAYGYQLSAYVNCENTPIYGPSSSESDDDNLGAIASGVIGAFIGIILIAGVVYYFAVFRPASQTKKRFDEEENKL